jgi:hypothetical protein
VVQQAGQLAAAEHGGLVHHQHCPPIQLLVAVVQVGQEPVAGGELLEPFCFQADGGDPGRRGGQGPVAVQLPGMPRHAQGEGLARPRPPHDHGDTLAALANVPHHALLVGAGGRVGGQRGPYRVVGDDGGLLAGAVDRGGDQPLLDPEQLGGEPAALLQRPLGHHADRPFDQKPIG